MSTESATLRSFSQFVADVEDGQLQADLSTAVRDVVAALHDASHAGRGKATGKLAIVINFKLEGGVIEVSADYATKLPKLSRGRSVFWATPENNLTRRNPRQHDLPLRDASGKPEIRTAQ